MKADAEAHAAEDAKQRELVDTRNQAEQMVFQTRKQLEEHGDKVSPEVRGQIESAANDVEERIKGDNVDAIKAALTALSQAAMELGKVVYEQTTQQQADATDQPQPETGDEQPAGATAGQAEDVIDAEYEVKE